MRILWITGNFYPQIGGLQVYTDRLTNSLCEQAEIGLLTEANQYAPQNSAIAHFGVANLTRPLTPADWQRAINDVASVVAEFRPDIVHFSNANVAVYWPAVPVGVAMLATVHGNDLTAPWQGTPGEDPTTCIVAGLNRCDHVLTVSNHGANLVARWGVHAPVTVLTSGCDLEFFQPRPESAFETRLRYGIPHDCPLIFTVGRLVPRKGHLLVLEALRQLSCPAVWLVAGDGALRASLLNRISRNRLQERVLLLGEIPDQDLLDLYNACDVFVLTPDERQLGEYIDSEGFGLVFHEAGACGKPVIASNVSGCKEAVFHGITGLVVPPGDAHALARAIEDVLTNHELADSLGRGGHALVKTLGGWPRLAWQIYELYEQTAAASFLKCNLNNS